jgi:hypothetical protein
LKEEVHTKDLLTNSTPIAAAISFDSSLSSLLKDALPACSRTVTAIYWCDTEEEHHRAWTIDLIEDKEDVAGQTSIVGRVFVCARARLLARFLFPVDWEASLQVLPPFSSQYQIRSFCCTGSSLCFYNSGYDKKRVSERARETARERERERERSEQPQQLQISRTGMVWQLKEGEEEEVQQTQELGTDCSSRRRSNGAWRCNCLVT